MRRLAERPNRALHLPHRVFIPGLFPFGEARLKGFFASLLEINVLIPGGFAWPRGRMSRSLRAEPQGSRGGGVHARRQAAYLLWRECGQPVGRRIPDLGRLERAGGYGTVLDYPRQRTVRPPRLSD